MDQEDTTMGDGSSTLPGVLHEELRDPLDAERGDGSVTNSRLGPVQEG